MRAYKVLKAGRSEFTGNRWPLPHGQQPGSWVTADGPLKLCFNGIHACTAEQLPQWLGPEIWEIELDGEILHTDPALIASRGRLVSAVGAWSDEGRRAFADFCATRAHAIAASYPAGRALVEKIDYFARGGLAAAAGYWTALLAGEQASGTHRGPEYNAAFAAERAEQAGWLNQELGLV